ncbi:MAG: hypothetical protein Q6373_014375 [Candidatus Sigynarchaeota archaeon]
MKEKIPSKVRSIDIVPGKLTISLYQVTLAEVVIPFVILFGILAIPLIITRDAIEPPWLAIALPIILLTTLSIPFWWMLSVHFKPVTIQGNTEAQVLVVSGKRSHSIDASLNFTFFVGTIPFSEIDDIKVESREITGPKGTRTYYALAVSRRTGDPLYLHGGSKMTMNFLASKLGGWLSNAR